MNKTAKIIILGLLTIIGFLIFGFFQRVVFFTELNWEVKLILFTSSFIVGLGSWGINAYLIDKRWIVYLISMFASLILLLFMPFNIYFLALIIILFLATIFATERIRVEKEGRSKIMLYESTNSGVKSILTIFCLIAALNYYYSPMSSQTTYNIPIKYQEKILSYTIPSFSLEMNIDEFIYALMAKSEGTKIDKNSLKNYITGKQIEINPQEFIEYKQTILDKLKISDSNLTGDEKIKDTKIINQLFQSEVIKEYLQKYSKIIKLVLTVSLFMILLFIWRIIYPLIYLYIWLIYKLLSSTGFTIKNTKQIVVEKIDI